MTEIEYTALCTLDDVTTQAGGKIGPIEDDQHIENAITEIYGVRDEAEAVLDRLLIVRKHSQYIETSDWVYEKGQWRCWAEHYPVVEVKLPATGVTAAGEFFYTTQPIDYEIEYYAGYRRRDTDLTDLVNDHGLSDLTIEPPILPDLLRSLSIDGVLYYLERRTRGIATSTTTQLQQGGAIQQVAPVDPQWFTRELNRRAAAYRRFSH